jgi:hypothetical protein
MPGEAAVGVVAPAPANGAGACCHAAKGPGYATPLEAMEKGPREKLIYVTCVYNGACLNCLLCFAQFQPLLSQYETHTHDMNTSTYIMDECLGLEMVN